MSNDTNISIRIHSYRMNGIYNVRRFTEYRVDIDLETDSDGFDFVFANLNGVYTGIFSKFDEIDVILNGTGVIKGIIDSVDYRWDDSGSVVHVSGRDIACVLVDNDAIPGTTMNIVPVTYIKRKCAEYGINNVVSFNSNSSPISKLIVGTGESEISIMNNILMDSRERMWLVYDTIYVGNWDTSANPTYMFTRGSDTHGIPIKSLSYKDMGISTKSEVRIYGSMSSGTEKVVGIAKNDYLINRGIVRRMTKRSSNNDSASKYASNALRDVRDSFKDNIVVEVKVKTNRNIILPNKTARVIDSSITGIDSTFFIRSVTYSKRLSSGSETTIKMIPDEATFTVIWSGTNIAGKNNRSTRSIRSLDDLSRERG